MINRTLKFAFGLAIILLASCAKIFYTPDAMELAKSHKIIAVMPPSVSIAPSRKISADALRDQQIVESLNFQLEMYSWLQRRKMQGRITTEIMDVETTNAKLRKSGYPDSAFSPGEWCRKIGVDGIITSNYGLSRPMSEGGAVAIGLIFGVWGATNEVNVSMNIYDGINNKLIWNYNHNYSGSVGSTPERLVDALMRHASRKMPYTQ